MKKKLLFYLLIIFLVINVLLLVINVKQAEIRLALIISEFNAKELIERNKEIDRLKASIEKEILIRKILICESSLRHNVFGDNGESYGIAQMQKRTFYWMVKESGMKNLSWKNLDHQIELLGWALDNGYGKYWTCYKKCS